MKIWKLLIYFFIYFVNGFQTSYTSGNSAKLQLQIYKELGLIKEPFYKRLIKSFTDFKIVEFQDIPTRAKCAFIGIDNKTVFIPYYSFVVIEPDIRHQVIHDCSLDIDFEYIKKSKSYLEYLFTYM